MEVPVLNGIQWKNVYGVYDEDRHEIVHVSIYPNWVVARREYFRLLWDYKTYGSAPALAKSISICDSQTGESVSLLDLAASYGVKFGVSNESDK